MKKLILIFGLISNLVFGQSTNPPIYDRITRSTIQYTGLAPKAKGISVVDSIGTKQPIFIINTGRVRIPKVATSTDTSLYTKVLAVSGDSIAFIPKSYFGGGGSGSGTVTNVSVTSTNGVSGTVANATTTPAITLSTTASGVLKGNAGAFQTATSSDIVNSIALNSSNILVGNASNVPEAQSLSLNANGGTFGLGNTGILTMPDATSTSRGLLTSTDYKKYLASDLGGVLFTDNYTRANNASLGANYTQSGTTMSILSNKLRMTNAAGSLSWTSNNAKVTGISPSNLENFEVSATITVPTLSSTTFGASIGFESTTLPTYGQSFEVRFAMETANQGKILFYNTQTLINLNKATGSLTISSGNTTTIKVVLNKNEIIATWTNTTTNTSLTQSFVFELGRTTVVKGVMANTHYVTLFSQGGTIDIDDLIITSTTKKGGIWKLGDSITMGYSAGDISKRAVDVLSKNYVGNFTAFGAGNLRTEELTSCVSLIAAHLPEEVIISSGVNNIRAGESAATIQGRVATFLTALNAATSNYYTVGINFFVESLVPQTLQDVSATNALLASTYTNGYIDTFTPLRYNSASTPNTAYYNVDGIHPNAIGFQEQAKAIAIKRGYSLRNQTDINDYSVRALSNGFVGIGDVTPQTYLDVVGSKSQIRVSNTTSSATDNGLYMMSLTGGGNVGYNTYFDSTNFIAKGNQTSSITFGQNALRFFADSGATIGNTISQTQKMTITKNGVGIGKFSPILGLEMIGVGGAGVLHVNSTNTDNGGYVQAIPTGLVLAGNTFFNGTNFIAKSTTPSSIAVSDGAISFRCNSGASIGGSYTLSEVMRVTNTGTVGIGMTSPIYPLDIVSSVSQIHLNNTTSDVGAYLIGVPTSAIMMFNNSFNGTNFIAKGTDATSVTLTSNSIRYNINSGLTAGSSFAQAEIMRVTATGLGIGTTSPTSTLNINGSLGLAYVAKTGTYTATSSDYLINCTANTFTVTLPTAVGITGRIYEIVNSGAGTITVATTSSQTFVNVTATPTTLSLITAQGKSVRVMSNGANWIQLN